MRFLHTSDWHLGKKTGSFSRIAEQTSILEEIIIIAEENHVDAVLLAGDIFDTFNPSSEAEELLYQSVKQLAANGTRPVFAIAGNHDAAERIQAPDPLARACGIIFAGFPDATPVAFSLENGIHITHTAPGFLEFKLPGFDYPARLIMVPYANELRLKKFLGKEETEKTLATLLGRQWQSIADQWMDDKGVNLLMAHLYFTAAGESIRETEDERSILFLGGAASIDPRLVPPQVQYTALGHIHGFHVLKGATHPVVYCSAILQYSIDDPQEKKYVTLVDIEPGQPPVIQKIPLQSGFPMKRKKFENIPAAVIWLQENQECYVELTVLTEDFLAAADRKLLYENHPRILQIIPEIKNTDSPELFSPQQLDMGKSKEALFKDYYTFKKNAVPSEKIMHLFHEILHTSQGETLENS